MKETKRFFDRDNRLNKGYTSINNSNDTDHSLNRKRFEHIFPPVDIIEAYENLYPGAAQQIINLAEQEQSHRHVIEKNSLVIYERSRRLGLYFAFTMVLIIAYVSLELFKMDKNIQALMFCFIAYGTVFGISLLSYLKNIKFQDKKHNISTENSATGHSNRHKKPYTLRQANNAINHNATKRRRYN